MEIAKYRRYYLVASIIFIVCYCGYKSYIWWLRTEPVDRAATKILEAYETQNTKTLWYYSDVSEKDALHMDYPKFERFLRTYVWPQLTSLQRKQRAFDISSKGDLFSMTQYYEKAGNELFLDYVVFSTPQGPKANILGPAITAVFQIKYGAKHKDVAGIKKLYRIRADGIRQDKKELESLGIMGFKDSSPGRPMGRWDLAQAIFEKYGYGSVSPGLLPVK